MAKLFRGAGKGNSALFAAQLKLPDAVRKRAKDIQLSMEKRQGGGPLEIVGRFRFQSPKSCSVEIVDKHFIRRRTIDVETFRVRIDLQVLETPSRRLPFVDRPFGHELSIRIEDLDP